MDWQQILFLITAITAFYFFGRRILFIRRNILLGKKQEIQGLVSKRIKHTLLFAFGQKKMFKRPGPAILHFFIYAGFIIINLEIIEIIIDGIFGTHRIFYQWLGDLYPVFISIFEILAVLVIIACILFLARRYILKIKRFYGKEMTKWPRTDATLILLIEWVLMTLFLVMNIADNNLQLLRADHYTVTGPYLVSGALTGLFSGLDTNQLILLERIGWWGHILGIMAFSVYITYSKHLHIFLAFPNQYFTSFEPSGTIENMPSITKEVQLMLNPEAVQPEEQQMDAQLSFGAKDVKDLSWKNLMDAYSCTECGRCTSVCPAHITGKLLSPRKIMMDTRDRLEEYAIGLTKNGKDHVDGKSLIHDYVTTEELNACTTCQACVEECPVNIRPLDIIVELRRHLIMEEANAPNEWNQMFGNIENNAAPWQFSPEDRDNWINE